jgi:hypothetical protein
MRFQIPFLNGLAKVQKIPFLSSSLAKEQGDQMSL